MTESTAVVHFILPDVAQAIIPVVACDSSCAEYTTTVLDNVTCPNCLEALECACSSAPTPCATCVAYEGSM